MTPRQLLGTLGPGAWICSESINGTSLIQWIRQRANLTMAPLVKTHFRLEANITTRYTAIDPIVHSFLAVVFPPSIQMEFGELGGPARREAGDSFAAPDLTTALTLASSVVEEPIPTTMGCSFN